MNNVGIRNEHTFKTTNTKNMNSNPIYLYKCPSCGTLAEMPDPMDLFEYGVKTYSDFSINLSKYHISPHLAMCTDCNTIYWLCKENKIERDAIDSKSGVAEIEEMRFLELDDYFVALSNGVVKNGYDEMVVRRQIWWLYNDRVKVGKGLCKDKDDLVRWGVNLECLLRLFDPLDMYNKLAIAEINRNLGAFDNCINILNSIEEGEFVDFKKQLIKECKRRNRWVVEIY